MKKIVIIGAGIAGLSFAYECLLRKHDVLIVEAESVVGGLCRSIAHNDCLLDIGVHILYLKDKEVLQKVKEIVNSDQWIKVKRQGKIYLEGSYVDWPLSHASVFQLPAYFSLKVLFEQLFKKKSDNGRLDNYEDELLALYGPTLYNSFFGPLTKKFLKTEPKNIHSDWAFSSLRSATKIEDKSFSESYKYLTKGTDADSKKDFNIIRFFLESLKANRNNEPFYYFKDGFGVLADAYKDKVLKLGAKIINNASVDSFVMERNKVKQCIVGGNKFDADQVVWTGNLYDLCRLLGINCSEMKYLHTKYVYFFLKECNGKHQVCYYADPKISFVRGTILSNHSKSIIRNKKINDLVCLEYTFKTKEDMESSSEAVKTMAINDLKKAGLIDSESAIESIFEFNAPNTYPILTTGYRVELSRLQEQLRKYENILTFGRQSTFGYDNADVIIKEVINHGMFQS
jgi:protoporphyrinogen oxidase